MSPVARTEAPGGRMHTTETNMSTDPPESTPEKPVYFSRDMVRGVPLMVLGRFALFFIQFGISVVLVNTLGKDEYGLLTSAQAIGEFLLVICSLGLNTALARYGPELHTKRNRAGLVRLIVRVALLQSAMVVLAGLGLWAAKSHFDDWYFKFDSGWLLLMVIVLVGLREIRMIVEDTLTAMMRIATVTALSIVQGAVWLVSALLVLSKYPTAPAGILTQAGAAAVYAAVGVFVLLLVFRGMKWRSPSYGIGKRRVLNLSLPSLLNTLGLMVLNQYSVVFFLTIFHDPASAGVYRLGCETPLLAISFLPMALRKLFTVGFAEAYARDEDCLGRLIASTYRALMLAVLPLAAFGVFFAPRGLVLIYGEEMGAAGPIAALFCVIHVLPLISMPLSMAIIAKERILSMSPLVALQVAINLALNVLLIPPFGAYGGVAAAFLTFVLTIPVRLYVVRRVVGGIYFPTGFLIKILLPLVVVAGLLYPLAPYLNLAGFFALGTAYLAFYPVLIRTLGLIKEEDVAELRDLKIKPANRVLNLLIKQ